MLKRNVVKMAGGLIILSLALMSTNVVKGAVSAALVATQITVTNNQTGKSDTIVVTGLTAGDIINVYSSATSTTPFGTATVASSETTTTVTVSQIGVAAGKVYLTRTATNNTASARLAKAFIAEPASIAPTKITIVNNKTGIDDTIAVTGLLAGDIVNVYSSATATSALATATVDSSSTTATLTISDLGVKAGTVYVSVTSLNKNTSKRTAKAYLSDLSLAPVATKITIANNKTGIDDTVLVSGLLAGDIVKIYPVATGGTAIATATVESDSTSVTLAISELGTKAATAYVSVTNTTKNESLRTAKAYVSDTSAAPAATVITITNKYGPSDKVVVTGLIAGDIVNVYNAATQGSLLGTATVASAATSATVTIEQLGTSAGTVYVSVTKTNKNESVRTAKAYIKESLPVITGTFTVAAGSVAGSTKFTAIGIPADATNDEFVYKVTSVASTATLEVKGTTFSGFSNATVLDLNTDIAGVSPTANNLIDLYEVNKTTGVIVCSKRITLVAANIKAPSIISAAVNGNTLTLSTDALKSTVIPAVTAFTVKVGTTADAVTAVAIDSDAKTVTLTLKTAILYGNTVTVAYTKPTSNYLQDLYGNIVATKTAMAVTNATVPNNVQAVGSATAETRSYIVTYTLTAGTFDPTEGISRYNWVLGGNDASDLGTIYSATIALSNNNKTATITLESRVGLATANYTISPLQAAFATGFLAPSSATPLKVTQQATGTGATATSCNGNTIVYTLASGTFDATAGTKTSNWTISGQDGYDLTIWSVELSGSNKTATITIPSIFHGNVVNIKPAQAAFATGTAPALPIAVTFTSEAQVPAIVGASLADKLGFDYDGEGIMTLPASSDSNTFVYHVAEYNEAIPQVGSSVSSWKAVKNQDTLILGYNAAEANGLQLYIAEVDANKKVVKFVKFTVTKIADFLGGSSGYVEGTVPFVYDGAYGDFTGTDVSVVVGGIARTFTVSVNGGAPVTVTIPGSVATKISVINQIATAIGSTANIEFDINNHLRIISTTIGKTSKVVVGGTDAALFFGKSPKLVTGTPDTN